MMVSKRIFNMQESPIRKLVPYAEKAKKEGKKVYHLNIGQPDIETPTIFFEYVEKYKPKVVAYTPALGIPELREAFVEYYQKHNINFDFEDIYITNGGSEAVIFALASICDPGDEVIVFEPFYANYKSFTAFLGIKLVPVKTYPEDGYSVPKKEKIEEKITSKTKAILFSNPSNPTGAVYSEEELKVILDIAKKYDLFVISDEVYREFVFDNEKLYSFMYFKYYDKTIIVDSISKRYSSCGARIGVFATKNSEIKKHVLKLAQMRLSPPMLEQYGTIGLLSLSDEYIEKVRLEYQKRRDVAFEELSKIDGIVFQKPKGTFYVSIKLPVEDSENFARWMLESFDYNGETVMVAPLTGFYVNPEDGRKEIRLAYVLNSHDLKTAVNIIGIGLNKYLMEK